MRRFWNWLVDQKTTTVRKWSTVLNLDRCQQPVSLLKPIGGSDDELDRKQRRTSSNLKKNSEDNKTSLSVQDVEDFEDYKPANFETFFEESSDAIESALERKHTLSPQFCDRKLFPASEISPTPSLDSRSGSFHPSDQLKKSNIQNANVNIESIDAEDEDEIYDQFDEFPSQCTIRRRHTTVVPQVSVSFADDLTTSVIMIGDDNASVPSSSTLPTSRLYSNDDSDVKGTGNKLEKYPQQISSAGSNFVLKDDKEKLGKLEEKKKISPLQLRRLSNVQVAQSLSGRRSSTTLFPLTSAQIHLVRAIWRQVYITKGPTVIGTTLLHGIFFKSIKTKEQFSNCSFPQKFPNRDSFNKAHAKASGELLDKIVDNLENLESISDCLFTVGAVHARIVGQDISRKIWNVMAETFIDCTLEWGDKKGRTETARKAWALIIAFVIEKIKEGHLRERRRLSQLKRSSWISTFELPAVELHSSVPNDQSRESTGGID